MNSASDVVVLSLPVRELEGGREGEGEGGEPHPFIHSFQTFFSNLASGMQFLLRTLPYQHQMLLLSYCLVFVPSVAG